MGVASAFRARHRRGGWRLGICLLLAGLGACPSRAGAGEAGEGPIVKKIDVFGTVTMTPEQVKYHMGTREGKPLDRRVLDEDFQRLFKMGSFADVQIKEEQLDGGVRLIVLLREKDILRRIAFRGNVQVRDSKFEDLVQSQVGNRFDWGQVNRDARAIEAMYRDEYYYFTEVTPEVEPFEDGVRLVFHIDEGGRLYIRDILFRGNRAFTKKELLKYMETRPSSWFSRGKYDRAVFEKDLERLRMYYQSNGYLDVEVIEQPFRVTDNEPASRWQHRDAYLHIDIVEGPQYQVGRVDFEGNKLVSEEEIRNVVETFPGATFSPLTAQEDAKRIRDVYGMFPSSRYFTRVWHERVLPEEGNVVDVVFHIEEGEEVIVEDIQILGLEKTKDYVVRRLVEVLPGEKIDSKKINESRRAIGNLGYFKRMDFEVKEGSAPNRAKVVVDLEEQPTGKLTLGAGVSSRENFIGSVQLSQRNFDYKDWPDTWKDFLTGKGFVGGGQNFNLELSSGSKSENYRFDFLNPWIFHRPIRFGFGGSYWTYSWSEYDEKRVGGYLKLGRRLWNKNLDGSITYKLERVTLDEFEDDASTVLRAEEGSNYISRGIFNLTYDSRDNRFDPTEGLLLSGTQEFAGGPLMGDKDFWRSFLEAGLFHPLWKDSKKRPWVLALHGEMGMADAFGDTDEVPVYERMYAGGIGSIRGFEFHTVSPRVDGDEIGGEMRTTASAEFFVPVWEDILRASVFYDVGAVWERIDDADDDPWRSSAGVGLHVKTPLGPLPVRVYYSKPIDKVHGDEEEKFQFSFGALF